MINFQTETLPNYPCRVSLFVIKYDNPAYFYGCFMLLHAYRLRILTYALLGSPVCR